MKVLISGSSGFIGYHLANFLLKKGLNVAGIDNHNNYYSRKIKDMRLNFLKKKKKFKFFKTDLKNTKSLSKVFEKFSPDIIFHLAGQPGVLYSLKNPRSYELNNLLATKNICSLSKKYKIKKFFFASSSSVYGDQKKFPIKETSKLNPKNPYATTKLSSEQVVRKSFNGKKINFLIFRFFTVYGPYGRPDMFIHKLLNSINKNKTVKLYNGGMNYRDFTYVDDVVKILFLALKKNYKNGILNICRSNPIKTLNLLNIIKKNSTKKNIKIKKIGFVKGEILKTHGCNKKLRNKFGMIKFTNLKKGIKQTIKEFDKFGI